MNKILEKAIAELKKEIFSKEYVLGMLETLVEMQGEPPKVKPAQIQPIPMPSQPTPEVSPEEVLNKMAEARLKEVQAMTTIDEITPRN